MLTCWFSWKPVRCMELHMCGTSLDVHGSLPFPAIRGACEDSHRQRHSRQRCQAGALRLSDFPYRYFVRCSVWYFQRFKAQPHRLQVDLADWRPNLLRQFCGPLPQKCVIWQWRYVSYDNEDKLSRLYRKMLDIYIICIYIYTCIWFKRSPFKTVLFVTSWVALIFPGDLTHAMWPSMNEWIWSVWSAKAKVGTEVLALLHGMQLSHARICRRFKGWVCHVTRSLSQ